MRINDLTEGTVDALRSAGAYASDLVAPTVRLGVTGLQRSGKTVFTTALVHNLIAGGRLPFFRAVAEGRVRRAWLEAQPDDEVPRFDIERHLDRLYGTPPAWPDSTRRISQLRVTLEFVPGGFWSALVGVRKLHIDIVDYPGEWLLDLPLLGRDYADWSGEAIRASREPVRAHHGAAFNAFIATLDPGAPADEQAAMRGAELFRAYLTACRNDAQVFSGLSPGRFLMPGDPGGFAGADLHAAAGRG
ncbi:MAG: YcjX family protein [Hyphomicrobiaceae bacterium]